MLSYGLAKRDANPAEQTQLSNVTDVTEGHKVTHDVPADLEREQAEANALAWYAQVSSGHGVHAVNMVNANLDHLGNGKSCNSSFRQLATWQNKNYDQPVTVIGELGERGGKRYYAIEGSNSGIPEDELEFI